MVDRPDGATLRQAENRIGLKKLRQKATQRPNDGVGHEQAVVLGA
jgi:hypothetical protein